MRDLQRFRQGKKTKSKSGRDDLWRGVLGAVTKGDSGIRIHGLTRRADFEERMGKRLLFGDY